MDTGEIGGDTGQLGGGGVETGEHSTPYINANRDLVIGKSSIVFVKPSSLSKTINVTLNPLGRNEVLADFQVNPSFLE